MVKNIHPPPTKKKKEDFQHWEKGLNSFREFIVKVDRSGLGNFWVGRGDFTNPVHTFANNIPMGTSSQGAGWSSGGEQHIHRCPICKIKIAWWEVPKLVWSGYPNDPAKFEGIEEVGKGRISRHQCQKCSKCGNYSSYEDFRLHELYECSNQSTPNQSVLNQQIQSLQQLTNQVNSLISNLQNLTQQVNNSSNLTPQQKQSALNNFNSQSSSLQKLLLAIQQKQDKLNDLAKSSSVGDNSPKRDWTPWIIGGCIIGGIVIIVLIVWLIFHKNKKS